MGQLRSLTTTATSDGLWKRLRELDQRASQLCARGIDATRYDEVVPGKEDQVFVAMSSGVDSSLSAALMKARGYKYLTGIYMDNWNDPLSSERDIKTHSLDRKISLPKSKSSVRDTCVAINGPDGSRNSSQCVEKDWKDVQAVARYLDIPVVRINLERHYWTEVFEPMLEGYRIGETPNPDVGCNRHIKFGRLIDRLKSSTCKQKWWLVTGHYASVAKCRHSNLTQLLRGHDHTKDQSFYLSTVDPTNLAYLYFPLGNFVKRDVRQLADMVGLPTANKADSQGLCFVSSRDKSGKIFRKFLEEYLNPAPGDIVTHPGGKVVGTHRGIWHATIGQRSGVTMPQADTETSGVWYVCDKIPEKNQIVICRGRHNPALYSEKLVARSWKWLDKGYGDLSSFSHLTSREEIQIQVHSLQMAVNVSNIKLLGDDSLYIEFAAPIRGVTPGQNVVLYSGSHVLGGGVIDKKL